MIWDRADVHAARYAAADGSRPEPRHDEPNHGPTADATAAGHMAAADDAAAASHAAAATTARASAAAVQISPPLSDTRLRYVPALVQFTARPRIQA